MRLRSLQIKGFKSFANDTLLNFNENVIGIVGPNGSGKSNIVDAIRWVLGEQKSKELRLEAMSDVIFNGTKTKKEAATATVSLTFDNTKNILPTDYQTVTISRTLYRSSESEYRLNNVVCRLKDINSLFLDTGIGSNSYAIIALGMVDDILDDKENARRRMFEQAAGISKYKVRKRETLNKLKSATEDLNRIDDLLFEIEGNLKSLEKQARRTQKYLDLKAEYKDVSIKHAVISVHRLKKEYKGISDQLVVDQDTYRNNDAQILKLDAHLAKEKKVNADKETLLSDHQKRLNELVYQIRNKEGEKSLLNQKLGFKKQNKEQLNKSILSSEDELLQVSTESENLKLHINSEILQLEEIKNICGTSKLTYDNIKAEYNSAKLSFDTRQKEKQELEIQVYDSEKSIAIYKNTIENHERENVRTIDLLESKSKENQKNSSNLHSLSSTIQYKENELLNLQESENKRKEKLIELESQRDKLQNELQKINRNIDSKQNEYDLLKSMIDNFEGFPESVKFLYDNWRTDLVILSDVLDVTDEYKAPLELYLDQYLNHYVVETPNHAIQCINLLKNSQKGKANFFILSHIKSSIKRTEIHENRLIRATDVVKTPPKFKDLINCLLEDVYIFNGDLDELDSNISENLTIISSNGTFLRKGFTISGGSVGLFEGKKIGRKQNLEKLASFLDDNNKTREVENLKHEKIKKEIETIKISDLNKSIEHFKKELQIIEQDKIRVQHHIQSFENLKTDNESKVKAATQQIKEIKAKILVHDQQILTLKNKIGALNKPEENQNSDIDQLGEKLSAVSENFNNDNIRYIRQQNLVNNFEKDKDFKDLKVSELRLRITTDKQKLMSENRERIDIEDELIRLDKELQSCYAEKKNFQSTLSEAEQDYFKAKNTITASEDSARNLSKIQSQLQHNIQILKDKYSEQKFQIQSVAERIRIEFNESINDHINKEIGEDEEFNLLNEDLEKIKLRMSAYGDVNPLAVDAYNEMKLRYDNINVQRKDILDAKDSLLDTMKEIETTATTQFMAAFSKVRENFITVFRSLFTEDDTCDLILLDKNNPLESEIEIIAKPKGKKPRSLSQLSGGEKTLTATALLFALYLLKPAPFCIFDEVDAPLDDANIQKFNKIIQNFSSESQFIIVTHNKSTMAEVDVLYGVYMPEPGISSVSSVDFRALKHEPLLENIS